MSVAEALYPVRKHLVVAAEKAMKEAFSGSKSPKLEKSQLNHLIAVCNEAACSKEIELYLRYQASRDGTPWPLPLVQTVIADMTEILQTRLPRDGDTDALETGAWSLYAVYLARCFTYQKAANKQAQKPTANQANHRGRP